jgi:hypothetical protein
MKEIYGIEVMNEDIKLLVACNPGEIETVAKAIASGTAREVFYVNTNNGERKNAWPECYDNNEPMVANYVYREA